MQPFSGNQHPDLLTSLMKMSYVLHLPRKMHLCRSSSNAPCLPFGGASKPSRFAHFWQGAQSLATTTRNEIWMSKSGPNVVCFVHVDFETCFAPQRRALFRHRNFQKWSENGVFCTFWLRNVLRATTACTFSTSQLPKVVRERCPLHILTSKCASRHNDAHFFIAHLARWLRTRRFSEPTFRPSGDTNHWKNTVSRDFSPFRASASSFFWLFLFSDLLSSTLLFSLPLPSSAFHLSILSEVWLLNFLRFHIYIYIYIYRIYIYIYYIYTYPQLHKVWNRHALRIPQPRVCDATWYIVDLGPASIVDPCKCSLIRIAKNIRKCYIYIYI